MSIGDRVKHLNGQCGTVYAVDPGSASTPLDQVIAVKLDDGTSVNARASEFMLITPKADREFRPPPANRDPQGWMAL